MQKPWLILAIGGALIAATFSGCMSPVPETSLNSNPVSPPEDGGRLAESFTMVTTQVFGSPLGFRADDNNCLVYLEGGFWFRNGTIELSWEGPPLGPEEFVLGFKALIGGQSRVIAEVRGPGPLHLELSEIPASDHANETIRQEVPGEYTIIAGLPSDDATVRHPIQLNVDLAYTGREPPEPLRANCGGTPQTQSNITAGLLGLLPIPEKAPYEPLASVRIQPSNLLAWR